MHRTETTSPVLTSLAAGMAGAAVLTAVHETTRRVTPDAPRMDILGERAIAKMMRGAGKTPPRGKNLHRLALGGDLVSNSLYYAMVGSGRDAWVRGAALGLAAGIGAVVLPPVLGLGRAPRGLTARTKAMTVGYYLLGGLAAAAASRVLSGGGGHDDERDDR
jgi:hypothetical protein